MKQKYIYLFLPLMLLCSCSGLNLIHERTYQGKKQIVYEGDFHGITYMVIKSKLRRELEYTLRFDCHTPWGQSLSKVTNNEEWWAVTDTIPDAVFLERELNENGRVMEPIVFMLMTNEETELLRIGIEKSSACNVYTAQVLLKVIGYVKTSPVKDIRKKAVH